MASQFLKRKKKEAQSVVEVEAQEPVVVEEAAATAIDTSRPYTGYDIFYEESTRKYKAVVFSYNPVTGVCAIDEIRDVSRSVALVFENNKHALKQLTKKIKEQV
jgi:hypothetical protein